MHQVVLILVHHLLAKVIVTRPSGRKLHQVVAIQDAATRVGRDEVALTPTTVHQYDTTSLTFRHPPFRKTTVNCLIPLLSIVYTRALCPPEPRILERIQLRVLDQVRPFSHQIKPQFLRVHASEAVIMPQLEIFNITDSTLVYLAQKQILLF
jgi:hypothetical protein